MTEKLQKTIAALKKEIAARKQTEEALQKSEERFKAIFENAVVGLYRTTPDGRILMANSALVHMLGHSSFEELAQRNLEEDENPSEYPRSAFKQHIESEGKIIGLESIWLKRNGDPLFVRESATVVRDRAGKVLYYEGTVEDITERKRAEEALRQSKSLFQSLIEALPQNIFSKDLEGRFTFANQRYCITQGKSLTDIIGKTDFDLHPIELAEKYRADDRRVIETGQILEIEEKHQPSGGEKFYVQVIKTPMYDSNGQITGILGIFWDITERRWAEKIQTSLYRISEAAHTARKLEELFHLIHEIVGELIPAKNFYIALYDFATQTLRFPYFMDECDETPAPGRLRRGLTEYVLRTETPLLASPEMYEELVKRGEVERIGSPFIGWLGVPLRVHEKTIGVLVIQNYTEGIKFGEEEKNILMFVSTQIAMAIERVRAEEALRENEERYRNLVENAPLGILSVDLEGNIMNVNPMLVAMLGSPSIEDVRAINVFTSPSLINAGIAEDFRRCLDQGYPDISERHYTTEWNKQVYLRYHLTPIRDKEDTITGVQAIIEDSTERMLVEKALKESEAEYRSLFKNMHSGFVYHKIIVDEQNHPIDYVFLEVNEAFELLTGLKGIIGKRATEVFPEIHTIEPDLIQVYGQVALTEERLTFDSYFESFGMWFSISAYSPEKGYFVTIFDDITERKWAEESLRKLNEELEQRVEARTIELQRTNKFLQKSLETLERAQKQLVESEKMAALGGLVAGVAHEINTPLGVGVTAASHLAEQSREIGRIYHTDKMKRSDLEKYLKTAYESTAMILENLRRAAENIRSFKQVAVDQTHDRKRVFKLKQCIDNVLLSLHPKLQKTHHTIMVHCPEDLKIDSYPGAFSHIATNFVMNSLIHGFENEVEGHIEIQISEKNGTLRMRYSDDGKGMSAEECLRIFEPFYTTRRGQGGSGLGLHIVYNLVTQRLNGHIECESTPGSGTTFTIEIPIMQGGTHE